MLEAQQTRVASINPRIWPLLLLVLGSATLPLLYYCVNSGMLSAKQQKLHRLMGLLGTDASAQATANNTRIDHTNLSKKVYPEVNRRVALLTIGAVAPSTEMFMKYMYWTATASKQAYALSHGYPLYVASHLTKRYAAWDKLVAIKAVMQHSAAEWVWCIDSDAAIMNLTARVEEVINEALNMNPNVGAIAARDCNAINTGSYLARSSNWTVQHISDAWFLHGNKEVPHIEGWWENAALFHLYNTRDDVKAHYHITKQKRINAYPDIWNCNDGSGHYQEGDLMLHFPNHALRTALTTERFMRWLNSVPVFAVGSGNASTAANAAVRRAHVYQLNSTNLEYCQQNHSAELLSTVEGMEEHHTAPAKDSRGHPSGFASEHEWSKKSHVLVQMSSAVRGVHVTDSYCVTVQHAPQNTNNPGWPLEQPALMVLHSDATKEC